MTQTETATGTRDALAKGSFYQFDPDQLILVVDPLHDLYDPRATEAPDEGLVLSMMQHGFRTGSSVELESANEGLLVVDGRRRVLAAREAKRRQLKQGADMTIRVRCIIVKGDAFSDMVLANSHRLDETILQKGAKAQRALDMGHTMKQVASLFGVTTQSITNWTEALRLPDAIRKALDKGEVTLTIALALAKKSPEEQEAILATATTVPLKGESGKARVKKAHGGEVSKALSKSQIRRLHEGLREHPTVSENIELAMALLEYIMGECTYRKLLIFEPLAEIAKATLDK